MPWIIALAFIAIVALIIVSFAVHSLVSPCLLGGRRHRGLDQVPPAPLPAIVRLPPGRIPAPGRLSRLATAGSTAQCFST
jgi:hypothetical protein